MLRNPLPPHSPAHAVCLQDRRVPAPRGACSQPGDDINHEHQQQKNFGRIVKEKFRSLSGSAGRGEGEDVIGQPARQGHNGGIGKQPRHKRGQPRAKVAQAVDGGLCGGGASCDGAAQQQGDCGAAPGRGREGSSVGMVFSCLRLRVTSAMDLWGLEVIS